MSDTIIDYEHQNEYLPQSLREFIGQRDRITHEDFRMFIPMYKGIDRMAVFNNQVAAEFASGYTDLNYKYLRSGAGPRLLKILVSKTVGRVWYQTDNEEQTFNTYLDNNYFSDVLYKSMQETAMTARSIMVLYKNNENVEIMSYNLFRHNIKYDAKRNVKEAWIYLTKHDEKDYGCIVCEHRYYQKKDGILKPYQKFVMYGYDCGKVDYNEVDAIELDSDKIPQSLKERFKDVNFDVEKELPFPNLGVYDLRYTKMNSKWLDSDIPEAMFIDAVDNGVTLESSITGKEVEKEIGRGQLLVPEFEQVNTTIFSQDQAGGRVLRTINTTYKSPIMKPYPTRSMEDSKPMNVQFDIRSDQWIGQIDNDTERLCACVGISVLDYDPRLLQTGQRTDDEINAMTDITANTVKDFRNLNQAKINQMLTDIATFYNLDTKVSIRWDMAAILNPTKNTQLVKEQLAAGLISRKEAIRRVNPDLTPNEIDELYDDIMSEIGAMATENRFNNF